MPFKLLDSLSLPGDPARVNEDSFGHDARAALVLDGATPLGPSLMPGASDAAWIAQFGTRRLMAHLKEGEMPDAALAAALAETEKSFTALARGPVREKWQLPCASMMLVAETRTELQFRWFGDCAALIDTAEFQIIGETHQKRAQEAGRARDWTNSEKLPEIGQDRAVLARLRAARSRINSGRNWLFSPDHRAAAHVQRTSRPKVPAILLLATDGFFALVSDYGAYDAEGLMQAAKAKGLAALGEELRRIEDGDTNAARYPRFKKSDDATALLVEVT
jgi:hypothetical protein